MPIIDPSLFFSLTKNKFLPGKSNSRHFYIKYLQVASKNRFRNSKTVLTYIMFKKDASLFIGSINKNFETNLYFNKANEESLICLYETIYKCLSQYTNADNEIDGLYYSISLYNKTFNFFLPNVIEYSFRHWLLSDSSIAILVINDPYVDYPFLQFEIDMMHGAGFHIILFLNDICIDDCFKDILLHIRFAEIHICSTDSKQSNFFLDLLINTNIPDISFVYFYSKYENFQQEEYKKKLQLIREKPRITFIQFNGSPYEAFRHFDLKPIHKFHYCQNGFENDKVKIILYGIPLYEKVDLKENCFTFQFVKDYSVGYVSKEDFFYPKKSRIPISLDQNVTKYVTFRDIHNINKNFYANFPLYLSDVEENSFLLAKSIISYSKNHNNKNIKVKTKYWWSDKCKFLSSIVTNYKKFFEQKKKRKFDFLHNQIYVISEIYNFITNKSSSSNGIIFEIPTGEGKTSIITMAAATLAKQRKIVHIVTSNIVLANRDYNDSFSFFKNHDLKSTILLHKNELPLKSDLQTDNYPSEFFSDEIFENSLAMNFDACNIANKNVNIIYSTLTNFETLYLYMMQNCQGIIDKYYENCVLLIDEADSILIDELTNGTILSRPMKTNAEKILTSIYRAYIQKNKNEKELLAEIKEKYSECTDISTKDIKRMFEEIDIVQNDKEFNDGFKYLIVKSGTRKEIIPFDFDHTGLLERNKEFNGFIHQFIAIKEREKNKCNSNINVREISMNYLYISHPIYIKLYKQVFGLTGTIGDTTERSILNSIYQLNTRKMPKEHSNIYYEFPIFLSNSIEERNERIVTEIMEYHRNGYPVLAIFLSPREIDTIKSKIEKHPIYLKHKVDIGVYGGQGNKPNEKAGKEGSISLGTNICGRGTNIEIEDKPLHVIVSYHISNPRLLIQAYGRTARKNNFGTVHTICLKDDFFSVKKEISNNDDNYLNFFQEINKMQNEFIEYFRSNRNWIFDPKLGSVKLSTNDINLMRMAKINVNRSKAYNCIYPICMKVPTFLNIQAQKIFSLFNCPECKYSWRLFQQYIREMILQSWSIFISRLERKFYESGYNKDLFTQKKNKLINELCRYLPESKEKLGIVPTFLHIYNMVANNYKQILFFFGSFLPSDIVEEIQGVKKISRISLEFRPYSLKYEYGHKIRCFSNSKTSINYINDPELCYIKIGSPFVSITNRIDNIFNEICNVFNDFISDKINFKFFLRRTLGGCEFGLCLDCDFEIDLDFLEEINLGNKNSKYYFGFKNNCLIDTNPLFVFTIFVKSQAPLIAGLFIFLLLYLSNLIKNILCASYEIFKLLKGNIKILIKSIAQAFLSKVFGDAADLVCDKLCEYLQNIILDQISRFKNSLPKYYNLLYLLTYLFVSKAPDIGEKIGEEFKGKFGDKIFKGFNKKHAEYASKGFDHLFKIGFLLVLCIASFLMNFHKNKSVKFQTDNVAKQFTDDNRIDTISNYVNQNERIVDSSIPAYGSTIPQDDKLDISEFAQQLLQDMMENMKP